MFTASTDWLRDARWGLFFHYLASPASSTDAAALTPDEWNRRVDSFDAAGFARQVADMGAPYVMFTIGQNSGFYCAPNTTYDAIVGISPSKCSRRDLIADIADELAKFGIRTLPYLPSNAPTQDVAALLRLRFTPPWDASATGGFDNRYGDPNTDERLTEFQTNWEAIIREWSERWGEKISGWWIDGCMFADRMYRNPDAPNFESFAAALKSGNPRSIVAFNYGWVEITPQHRLCSITPYEDYTAGEADSMFPICKGRWIENDGCHAQWHVLTYAGSYWGRGEPRFPDELVIGYTKHANQHEGVVTWDIPVSETGVIPANFMRQIEVLHAACAQLRLSKS
jgi:hypothetical protein